MRGWWSENIDGPTDELGATFDYRYRDVHHCKLKIVELLGDTHRTWAGTKGVRPTIQIGTALRPIPNRFSAETRRLRCTGMFVAAACRRSASGAHDASGSDAFDCHQSIDDRVA